MITLHNLCLHRGGVSILTNINVPIKQGVVTAILGPNGAGKSSLLNCIDNTLTPSSGKVMIRGKHSTQYSAYERAKIGAHLCQSHHIHFPFTAQDIVMMGRFPHNQPQQEDSITAQKALAAMDALHLQWRIFPTLSGGEQQRVHLARVLAQVWQQHHAYLLLDEPLVGLDQAHQHHTCEFLQAFAKQYSATVCVVTHNIMLAHQYAGNIILLKNGTVYSQGHPHDTLTKTNIENVFHIAAHKVLGVNG